MNKLDKNGLTVNTISKTDGTNVFDEIDSKITLEEASENFLSLNGGTINGELKVLEGNIKINQHLLVNEGTRNIDIGYPYADKSGAYIAFRSATYSDIQPGHFIVGVTDGTNTRQLEVCSSGTLKWNNNLYFNTTNSTSDVSILSNGNYIKLGTKTDGAEVRAYSKNHTNAGRVELRTSDGTTSKYLVLKPDGSFTWNGSNVVTYSLLNNLSSNIYFSTSDTSVTQRMIGYGSATDGARLLLNNKNHSSEKGYFYLQARNGENVSSLNGKPDGTLTWGGKTVVTVNFKNNINWDSDMTFDPYFGFNNSKVAGPYINFRRGNSTTNAGSLELGARLEGGDAGDTSCTLVLKPNKTITWGGQEVLTKAKSVVFFPNYTSSSNILTSNGAQYTTTAHGYFYLKIENDGDFFIGKIGTLPIVGGGYGASGDAGEQGMTMLYPVPKGVTITRTLGQGVFKWIPALT